MIRSIPPKHGEPYTRLSPGLQFLSFAALFFGVFVVGNIIGILIAMVVYGQGVVTAIGEHNFKSPQVINALWIIQITGTSLPILVSPIIFGWAVVKRPIEYLWTNSRFPFVLLVLVFGIMLVSSPLIEWLSAVNDKMVLPKFLAGLQQWMRETEDQTRSMEEAMFAMPTVLSLIKNILIVGLFTAIAEEMMFRGVIQTIFIKWTGSTHAAVWITGILFSAFHFQFFGFLPRTFLGVIFGYFVVWSGSIWPAVWAHFLNNGSAIVATYLYQHKKISINPDSDQVFNGALYIASLVVVLFLLFLYRYLSPKPIKEENGAELG